MFHCFKNLISSLLWNRNFKLVLIEPASEDELNDFLKKLKEKGLDLKGVSIVNFDTPVLSFLETETNN